MSIVRDESTEEALNLSIKNGDLVALREITKTWNFKDEESVLRYALAVMTIAKSKKLFIENYYGEKIELEPTDLIKKF